MHCSARYRPAHHGHRASAIRALLGLLLVLLAAVCPAYEADRPRYALIIGNGDYEFAPLRNPVNDADDMAEKLRRLRYRVTLATNLNPDQFRRTIDDFYRGIVERNAVSVFYYAGHGVQLDNVNYLIPVAAAIDNVEAMQSLGVSMNHLLAALRRSASSQNVIILDACRNNPFEPHSAGAKTRGLPAADPGLRHLRGGLAPVEAPPGTLVAYATEPGNVAADGRGRNGTYTRALLRHIEKSETAEALFRQVRKDVLRDTGNRQTPWEHSSLLDQFYFSPPKNRGIPDIVGF